MKGVYCIENLITGKRYVGQSSDVKQRMSNQRSNLKNQNPNWKNVNRHLHSDVQKYGIDNFHFYTLQPMPGSTRKQREVAERKWMVELKTFVDENGYNLRSDDETGMVAHPHTRALKSFTVEGESNPNFNNRWSDEQKNRMSEIAKARHASGEFYGDDWRKKQGERAKKFWAENPDARKRMAKNVGLKKEKYRFFQYTKNHELVRTWESMREIISENPDFHVQAIYSVCGGHKKSYRGFVWKKELKI